MAAEDIMTRPTPASVEPACDVLIIEDDPLQAEELACILERRGLVVRTIHAGSPALHRIADLRPRVALVDFDLPDFDGVTLSERIRRLSPETALLVMSGRIDHLSEPVLERVGIYRFFPKPVETRTLGRAIRAMLKSAARTGVPATKPEKWFGLRIG
jgi:DNA-binding NtrC family response regulator